MDKKIYLITGSAGFIGFHLSNKMLSKGFKVIGIDNLNNYYDVQLKKKRNNILKKNKNYTFKKIDIKDYKSLETVFKKKKYIKLYTLLHKRVYATL
tara:strand:- start:136 stop:423 length:288 start_codon:yes stop_codon:yes gene_type:complete